MNLDTLRRTRDTIGIIRCDNCDEPIYGRVEYVGEWRLCQECEELEPTCDLCDERPVVKHIVSSGVDHETGPFHDEADVCQGCFDRCGRVSQI
jgi:hypothetical protein